MNEKFIDPLESLLNKHAEATNDGETTTPVSSDDNIIESNNETIQMPDTVVLPPSTEEENKLNVEKTFDVDYGENDIQDEIRKEEQMIKEERAARYEEKHEQERIAKANKPFTPPDSKSEAYLNEAIGFQTNNLAIVTTMLNRVIAKHKLFSGGIPDTLTPEEFSAGKLNKIQVMGELMECYHTDGEVITPRFEKIILDNWVAGEESVNETSSEDNSDKPGKEAEINKVDDDERPMPTVNINVKEGTPVVVNVDKEIVANIDDTRREINVNVVEVSEQNMECRTVIENSRLDGVIKTYDSGINDVPITLPVSGYRCTIRAINWFDFIKLSAPSSRNPIDNELKNWSIIYKHMKNVSIGEFKDFEDFLKKTKYQDKEILMWALLVATHSEEDHITLRCTNEKCQHPINIKYNPRSIAHIDEKRVTSDYKKTYDVAPGKDAVEHFEKVSCMCKRYTLPTTGYIVDVKTPSAYDYINTTLPLIMDLYKRYRPDEDISEANLRDPSMLEYGTLTVVATFVTSISIPVGDKEYKYSKWEDIEQIITTALDMNDSSLICKLAEQFQVQSSPIEFYVENCVCDKCKQKYDRVNITNIADSLLFALARRHQNTTVNLIEMP